MPTVYDELKLVFKVKPKAGESYEEFALKTAKKVNGCSEAVWNSLSEDTQQWNNAVFIAEEKRGELRRAGQPEKAFDVPYPELAGFVIVPLEVAETETIQETTEMAKTAKTATKDKAAPKGKGRPSVLVPTAKIKLLVQESPYREGCKSDLAFKKYKDGMTVAKLLEKGVPKAYIAWDKQHGHIAVE